MGHAFKIAATRSLQSLKLRLPDGRLMGYALYGDPNGLPVLAIHGTPGCRIMMHPADQFAREKGLSLIAPDRPGYGLSSACPNYSFDQWAADIEVLLSALKVDKFWLFGVSGGGPYATAIAALMPTRVRALALVSPVGVFDEEVRQGWSWRHNLLFGLLPRWPSLMKQLFSITRQLLLMGPFLFVRIFAFSLGKQDRKILNNPQHKEPLLAAFHEGLRTGISGVLEDLRLFANPWQLPLDKVSMPVVLWQGSNDLMVPAQAAVKLARSLPDVEIIDLQGHGHFWIFEHFEQVLTRLLSLSHNDDDPR